MYSDLLFDYLEQLITESSDDLGVPQNASKDYVSIDSYEITSDEESSKFNKPIGKYELVSIPEPIEMGKGEIEHCTDVVTRVIKKIVGKVTSKDRVLVVGLGNRHISSDSLGALVVGKINITIDNKFLPKVMAISPSVMGLTGIETVDIVEGVISKTKPTKVIIIDSLCAGAVSRLGKSIQITNTGLCPGSGIGNKRKCIDSSISQNVYSIGVPLLIYSSTFVVDTLQQAGIDLSTLSSIMQSEKKPENNGEIYKILKSLKEILISDNSDIIVSIKDIEECVKILSDIISNAINRALNVDGC